MKAIKICFFLFFLLSHFANAELLDEYDNINKYLSKIRSEIKSESTKLNKIVNSKISIKKKLTAIKKSIEKQKKILNQIEKKLNSIKKEKRKIEIDIRKLQRKKSYLKSKIKKLNIYLIDNQKYLKLKLLFFTKRYYEVKNNLELLEVININIYKIVKEYEEIEKKLTILNDKVNRKLKDIRLIKRLKTSVINKLEAEKLQQKQLLVILNEDETSIKQYLAILKNKQNELEKRFKNLNKKIKKSGEDKLINSAFFKNKGKLPWPTEGKVIEFFGPKKIKGFKGKVFNKGIKIQVEGDGYVYSIFDGEVKYIDWVRGLGNIIIINHDKFFYTLYANIDKVLVKKNQKVKKGDKIGIIDVDLMSKSAYLYFEIRKESKAIDPLKWLLKKEATE